MHRRRAGFAWAAIWAVGLGSCSKPNDSRSTSQAPATSASSSASASASVFASASSASASASRISGAASAGCRVLAVLGTATAGGEPLVVGALLDGRQWLDLVPAATLSLRHTLTSREFQLLGPGRILPCRDGSEHVLVARGRISTSAKLGVRPGAEVLIATPVALVGYGDAALDLGYDESGLQLRVRQGEAWMDPERAGAPALANPLRSGAEVRLRAARGGPQSALLACRATARAARQSAELVLGQVSDGGPPLGERARAHVLARKRARSACAVAAAAIAALAEPAQMPEFLATIADSDELWQRVPQP